MHTLRHFVLPTIVLAAAFSFAAAPAHKHKPEAPKVEENASPTNLSLRVAALQALYDLHATPQQMSSLRHLLGSTSDTRQHATASPTTKYVQALHDLHAALEKPTDDDKIDSLLDQLGQASEADHIDIDDDVTITDGGRQKAPEALKLFSASQIAFFIAANEGDIEDPAEILKQALEARDQKGDDWADTRDTAAEDIAALAAGVDQKAGEDVIHKVKDYLDKAHNVGDERLKMKEKNIPAEVAKLVGDIDSMQMLKNWAETELARLVSNPQLPTAIDERVK